MTTTNSNNFKTISRAKKILNQNAYGSINQKNNRKQWKKQKTKNNTIQLLRHNLKPNIYAKHNTINFCKLKNKNEKIRCKTKKLFCCSIQVFKFLLSSFAVHHLLRYPCHQSLAYQLLLVSQQPIIIFLI